MSDTRALYVKRELRLRMEKYGARYGSNMTVADAVLAGIILQKDMGIPESEWAGLGLATPEPESAPTSERERQLVAALLAVVPSHRSPANRCWCGPGAAVHSQGCLMARSALKAMGL